MFSLHYVVWLSHHLLYTKWRSE